MDNPFKPIGFCAGEFTFAQPNGVSIRAPLEFWVAAIMTTLTPADQAAVCERVERIRMNIYEVQGTDGYPIKVSRADGG